MSKQYHQILFSLFYYLDGFRLTFWLVIHCSSILTFYSILLEDIARTHDEEYYTDKMYYIYCTLGKWEMSIYILGYI